jgi:hypothetical protein
MMARQMTDEEKRWVRRLRRVLKDAPRTLELATIGDAELQIWCAEAARNASTDDLCDGGAETADVLLARVSSAVRVHGVSG